MSTDTLLSRGPLLVPDVKGVARSHPRHPLTRRRNARMTRGLAGRLWRLAQVEGSPDLADRCLRFADRLSRCALNEIGWRCGIVLCPRCARRTAIRYRGRVIASFFKAPVPLAFVTLTTPHEDLRHGLACLTRTFGRFRRRAVWAKTFGRGMAFVEFDFSARTRSRWNVHLHAVVIVCGPLPRSRALGEEWRECLAGSGATGSADCQRVELRGVIHRRHRG